MPGYKVTPVDPQRAERCLCYACGLLLRDAMQHKESLEFFCASCAKDRPAPVDYWAYRAKDKEVRKVVVYCSNKKNGCVWKGSLLSYLEEHQQPCQELYQSELADKYKHLEQNYENLKVEFAKIVVEVAILRKELEILCESKDKTDESYFKSLSPIEEVEWEDIKPVKMECQKNDEDKVIIRPPLPSMPRMPRMPPIIHQSEPDVTAGVSDEFDAKFAKAKGEGLEVRKKLVEQKQKLEQSQEECEKASKVLAKKHPVASPLPVESLEEIVSRKTFAQSLSEAKPLKAPPPKQ